MTTGQAAHSNGVTALDDGTVFLPTQNGWGVSLQMYAVH